MPSGKARQKGISKKGDRYLRQLLASKPAKAVAVALANKTARIAWSLMANGGTYEAGHRAAQYRTEALAAPV